jgi:hypothetical protein
MGKNLRIVNQTAKARLEHDLVVTRIGEMALRDLEVLIRGMLYKNASVDAAVLEGLRKGTIATLTVPFTAPASVVQMLTDDTLKFCLDYNAGSNYSLTFDAGEAQQRYDIVEARISRRDTKNDNLVYIADAREKTVTPVTRKRDSEVYLVLRVKKGTAGGSVPTTTAATAGSITGTVAVSSPLNFTTRYLLTLACGVDGEFVEIDCRGAVPATTTLAEIINKINVAGIGVLASNDGSNHLKITAPGLGENSVVYLRQPAQEQLDAAELILGVTGYAGYRLEYLGENKWFKVAEVTVPVNATSLLPSNVKDLDDRATWTSESTTVATLPRYSDHRTALPLDHPDGCVEWVHLSSDARSKTAQKLNKYRGAYARILPVTGDATNRRGLVSLFPVNLTNDIGASLERFQQEQQYPVSRLDQKQETTSSNYSVLTTLSEDTADRAPFTVSTGLLFATTHNRVGLYVKTKGSGYTHLRIVLHDAGNNSLGSIDIAIADFADASWKYADITATLVAGQTYHYHAYVIGFTSGATPVLGSNGTTIAFREMYKPQAGLYGSSSGASVVNILTESGTRLVPVHAPGDDTGFWSSGLDIMAVDFSNDTTWTNWEYYNHIGIDVVNGRVKFPSGMTIATYYLEFNTLLPIVNVDSRSIFLHEVGRSLSDWLNVDHNTDGTHKGSPLPTISWMSLP